jgi:hypothetical protein
MLDALVASTQGTQASRAEANLCQERYALLVVGDLCGLNIRGVYMLKETVRVVRSDSLSETTPIV